MKKLFLLLLLFVCMQVHAQGSQYMLSVSCTDGGEVTFEGLTVRNGKKQMAVNRNQSVTLTVKADMGFEVEMVTVNLQDVTADLYYNSYTVAQIQQDTEVQVVFAKAGRLVGLTATGVEMRDGVKTLEVPSIFYQPVIARVGESHYEEYHYVSPRTNETFDADIADGTSYYLFDGGSMAPGISLMGVHSWSDFLAYYGDGPGSYLSYYITAMMEYTRLKTSSSEAAGVLHYDLMPAEADLSRVSLGLKTGKMAWGSKQETAGDPMFALTQSNWLDGELNTCNDGTLSIHFAIPDMKGYLQQIARTANAEETWNACYAWISAEASSGEVPTTENFLSTTDSLNTIRLQVKPYGQEMVTSDEVVVVPTLIFINGIADNAPEAGIAACKGWWDLNDEPSNSAAGHLWKRARPAVINPAVHKVAYNRGIDLAPFLEIHYNQLGSHLNFMHDISADLSMSPELFRLLGLRLEFSLVDYFDLYHLTGESAHASLDVVYNNNADYGLEKVVLTPRSGDDLGETIMDKPARRDAIGREPLVRITLLDNKGQVIHVGYMKLLIVDNGQPTGVSEEIASSSGYATFYNLQGQRISHPSVGGIVIMRGKNGNCVKKAIR